MFSRNASSTFSFHTLLFIRPLQKEVKCASGKTFQYRMLRKKGTSENSSLRLPLSHSYLRPSQYNQKIQIVPKTRYTEIQQQQKNVCKVLQTPPTSIHLLHHITCSRNHPDIFPGFGIAIWRGREGQESNCSTCDLCRGRAQAAFLWQTPACLSLH